MKPLTLKEIFDESLENMSYSYYWECPNSAVSLDTNTDIRPVYFERIKPNKYCFGIDTSNILIKTYDHKIVSGMFSVKQPDLRNMLNHMKNLFDNYLDLSRISNVLENPYEEYEEKEYIDERSFEETLDCVDKYFSYFRTREQALHFYATSVAEMNVDLDRHKTTDVAEEALIKFPEVFI